MMDSRAILRRVGIELSNSGRIAHGPRVHRDSPRTASTIGLRSSPRWHRRQRAHRSRARARLHKRRSVGARPFHKDLKRLTQHHARPVYKEWMSQWNNAPWQNRKRGTGQDGSGGASTWSYWSGAWKNKTTDGKHKENSEGHGFPKYADMEVVGDAQHTAALATAQHGAGVTDSVSTEDTDFLKAVQKSLNQNRKLEARVRKLQEDGQKKANQWRLYEAKMKELYTQELARFQKDQDAIAKELAELEQQRSQALQSLLQLMDHKQVPATAMAGVEAATDRAWADFTRPCWRLRILSILPSC